MKLKKATLCSALSLLAITGTAHADWCDGTSFGVWKMENSKRIEKASSSVEAEYKRLSDIGNSLTHDIRHNILALADELDKTNSELAEKTVELCTMTRDNGYTGVQYDGITLNDENEITAQIRMNLASIQANESIIGFLDDTKAEYQGMMDRVIEKINEMSVLKKRYSNLIDTRVIDRASTFDETIANTCVAIDTSEKLRMSYTQSTRDELFERAAQSTKTSNLTSDLVETFKANCSLSQQWAIDGSGLNK